MGLSTDSRAIKAGEVFIALVGERFNGHAFLRQVAEAKASAVIISDGAAAAQLLDYQGAVIIVADTQRALGDLAAYHRRRINATVIGNDYAHPKVRLPGSGGAQEIAAWANRCYIMTPHQKRRFPEKVDFLTSAGYLDGRVRRTSAALRGKGPVGVVTDIGYMEPDDTGELVLTALHPGKTAQPVRVAFETIAQPA